eukprot:jgi/Chrzof1/5993/UNPLg00841.t1
MPGCPACIPTCLLLKYGLYSVRPALPESRSFQMVLEVPRCFQMFLDVSRILVHDTCQSLCGSRNLW